LGGLSKKSFLIKGLVADPKQASLIIDSGNLLFKTETLASDNPEAEKIAATGIMQATRAMGGTLAGVGTRDLAAGISFLQQHQKPPAFTWLSLNIVDPATQKPLFTPVLRRQAGEVKIAVLALTDHTAFENKPGAFQVLNWRDILPDALAKAKQDADFILLLSNYSFVENKEIARSYDAIDLILQAGHAVGNMAPILINRTLISQTETRGKYLGVMDIDWKGHGRWNEGSASQQISEKGLQQSTYTNRFIALKPSIPNEAEVEALLRKTQEMIDKQKGQSR
jgi:2',3'-cyclic-nucleotide 2'-phosphodiesterase (5'-nucleotidase family)